MTCVKLTRLSIALFAVYVVPGVLLPAADPVLVWKFKDGVTTHYLMDIDTNVVTNNPVAGGDVKINQTMQLNFFQRVKKVHEDGSADIAHKFTRVRLRMAGQPIGEIKYDSDSKEAPAGPVAGVTPIIESLIAAEFALVVTPQGSVKSVKIPEKLKKAVNRQRQAGQMFGFLTEDGFKSTFQLVPPFPKEAVASGNEWTQNLKQEMPFGVLHSNVIAKYAGTAEKGGDVHKIDLDLTLSIVKKEGAPFSVKLLSAGGTGTVLFDAAKGKLVKSAVKQSMKMEMDLGNIKMTNSVAASITTKPVPAPKKSKSGPKEKTGAK